MLEQDFAANDGRFPDDAEVEARYPLAGQMVRDEWPWLPATILRQCGPNEWYVRIDVDELAEPDELGDDLMWYPACFRDASELRYSPAKAEDG